MSYSVQQHQEKKNKLDDQMRSLNLSFRKLRIISEKVKESTNPKEAMLSQDVSRRKDWSFQELLQFNFVYEN